MLRLVGGRADFPNSVLLVSEALILSLSLHLDLVRYRLVPDHHTQIPSSSDALQTSSATPRTGLQPSFLESYPPIEPSLGPPTPQQF